MLKINHTSFNKNIFKAFDEGKPILTVGSYNDFNAMTVSWGGVGVLWNMDVAFVFIRPTRYTHEFSEKYDSFTLSFLGDKYQDAKILFGTKSGKDIDKFNETKLHPTFEPDFNGYYIAEADYVIRMKKMMKLSFTEDNLPKEVFSCYPKKDFHDVYICKINDILVKEELYDSFKP